MGPGG
ncbi:hypothetical protein TPAR_00365 [Tolypocladium paradoxum]